MRENKNPIELKLEKKAGETKTKPKNREEKRGQPHTSV
jgi:hypothetical protein